MTTEQGCLGFHMEPREISYKHQGLLPSLQIGLDKHKEPDHPLDNINNFSYSQSHTDSIS